MVLSCPLARSCCQGTVVSFCSQWLHPRFGCWNRIGACLIPRAPAFWCSNTFTWLRAARFVSQTSARGKRTTVDVVGDS